MTKLIEDAVKAGLKVSKNGLTTTISRNKERAIIIFENGTIIRANTDLSVCSRMNVSSARKLLQL